MYVHCTRTYSTYSADSKPASQTDRQNSTTHTQGTSGSKAKEGPTCDRLQVTAMQRSIWSSLVIEQGSSSDPSRGSGDHHCSDQCSCLSVFFFWIPSVLPVMCSTERRVVPTDRDSSTGRAQAGWSLGGGSGSVVSLVQCSSSTY